MAEELARVLKMDKDEVLESLTEESGFAYVAKEVDLPTAARIERLELPGIGQLPASRRTYPQGEMAGQTIGAVGSEDEGLTGLELGEEGALRGSDGERRVVKDALGEPIRLETVKRSRRRRETSSTTLDPAIEKATEDALDEVGEPYVAEGRDGDRDEPAQLAGPGDGQLAAGRPHRPLRSRPRIPAQPGDRVHLRAGLDLQGVHRLGRARRRNRDARRPPSRCRRPSRSPTARSKTPRNAAR